LRHGVYTEMVDHPWRLFGDLC